MTGQRTSKATPSEAKGWNPYYVAYARSLGLDPDDALARDREEHDGGSMAGFIVWIGEQWRAWLVEMGAREGNWWTEKDRARFAAWLVASPLKSDVKGEEKR